MVRLPTPAIAANDATAARVRQYWEQLSANERQQVLFLDEPDLVKQLYKLNLSLLCVGLMQRHLKAKASGVSVAEKAQAKPPASSAVEKSGSGAQAAKPAARSLAAADDPAEKTYELLEAMEFMDIGTGILTVKNELVESTDRLISLVGDVLTGFLSTVHVLTDAQFRSLFVTESEIINTWEDYQRLIAMLVEQVRGFWYWTGSRCVGSMRTYVVLLLSHQTQLILKSYVSFLEKRALQQMEALLLEESRYNAAASSAADVTRKKKKKSKKAMKKKTTQQGTTMEKAEASVVPPKAPSSHTDCSDFADDLDDESDCRMEDASDAHPDQRPSPGDMINDEKPTGVVDHVSPAANEEPEPEITCESPRTDLQRLQERQEQPSSGLNPNAAAFHPQMATPIPPQSTERKRKLDKYILRVPVEDVVDDEREDHTFGRAGADDPSSDAEEDEVEDDPDLGRWAKIRRFEDDSELEWQLQQVYASTSALFGWDFSRQQELPEPGPGALPWTDSTFWCTAPQDVVRYFSPGFGEPSPSHLVPPPAPLAPTPHSLYYFSPPPFLPLPSFAPEPPVPRDAFAYHGPVVSSPDFSVQDPGFHHKEAR